MKTIQFNLRSGLAAGSLKAVLALGIAAVVCTMGNPAQAAPLAVVNGDFSDLTGLSDIGAPWYAGCPAGWTSSAASPSYSVFADAGYGSTPPYVNLGSLGTLRQNVGTNTYNTTVTLTFDVPGTFSTAPTVTARITDGTNIIAGGSYGMGTSHTLVTYIPANTPVYVEFVNASGGGTLDNVSVSAVAAPLTVVNGNFSDLTGLANQGGGWYAWVPARWIGSPGAYSVYDTGSGVWANVGSLYTSSPWTPLHQDVGTLDVAGKVTLTFNMPSAAFGADLVGVIYDTSDNALSAVTSITTTGVHQITTTSDVPAGTPIRISFWGNGALTDVSISTVPAPPTSGYSSWASGFTSPSLSDTSATADPDNDGLSNTVEYALGLDPRYSDGSPGVTSNNGKTITFTKGSPAKTDSNLIYQIETSPTLALGSWTVAASPELVENADTIAITFPAGPVKNFARLKVTMTSP